MSPAAGETNEEGCLESQVDSRELIRERARQHGIEEASAESSQTHEIVQENRRLRAELVIIQLDLQAAREELMVARRKLEHAQALVSPLPYKAMLYVWLYWLFLGLLIFGYMGDYDRREDEYAFLDAFYLTSCTTSTVGYGDIPPRESSALIVSDVVGIFGSFMPIIFSHFVSRLPTWLDQRFLSHERPDVRFFYHVISSISTIVIVILSGVAGLYIFERGRLAHDLHDHSSLRIFLDILHLSIMTVTTIGYGDLAFTTARGRLFATFWIPFSTTFYAVASSFLVHASLSSMSGRPLVGYIRA